VPRGSEASKAERLPKSRSGTVPQPGSCRSRTGGSGLETGGRRGGSRPPWRLGAAWPWALGSLPASLLGYVLQTGFQVRDPLQTKLFRGSGFAEVRETTHCVIEPPKDGQRIKKVLAICPRLT
jgi:hypothetical protein